MRVPRQFVIVARPILVVGVLVLPAAMAAADNLLINPSFEDGSGGPEGWTTFPPNPPDISYRWDATRANSGRYSVSITGTGTGFGTWQQLVPVTPGVVYEFTGYVAFELAPPGDCHLQLVFRDAADRIIAFVDLPGHDGVRGFAYDFPPKLKVRAPAAAAVAEVNLFLQGRGTAWFDDIFFGPAPTGTIAGRVTSGGRPLPDARVWIWGDPWDAVYEAFTNAAGEYALADVPVAFPRYVLLAARPGYQTAAAGGVAVAADETTTVDFELAPGHDPADELRVKFGSLELALHAEPPEVPDDAVIPPDPNGYPEQVRPYLEPDEYIRSDDPAVQALAAEILASLPPESRSNGRAVAYAVYEWVSKNIEHDGVFSADPGGLDQPYRDVTSGIWQTISGEGWCWGRSFYDWAYRPGQTLELRGGICVEHAWLDCALLRALNIPARAAVGSNQFWLQSPTAGGLWTSMSTTAGRTGYREHGRLGSGFGTDSFPAYYPVAGRPLLHEDWNAVNRGLWRETHPWSESYPATPAGLEQALADLEEFARTGNAPPGAPPPPGSDCYRIHYADVTLNLYNLGDQRTLDVRFPLVGESETHLPLEHWAWWTNHPECVLNTSLEEVTNPPVVGRERWFHIEFHLTPLVESPDVDGDGDVDLRDLARLPAAYGACAGQPDYDPQADINNSGCVDLADLAALLASYGSPL